LFIEENRKKKKKNRKSNSSSTQSSLNKAEMTENINTSTKAPKPPGWVSYPKPGSIPPTSPLKGYEPFMIGNASSIRQASKDFVRLSSYAWGILGMTLFLGLSTSYYLSVKAERYFE
jgi:hypothetical protein